MPSQSPMEEYMRRKGVFSCFGLARCLAKVGFVAGVAFALWMASNSIAVPRSIPEVVPFCKAHVVVAILTFASGMAGFFVFEAMGLWINIRSDTHSFLITFHWHMLANGIALWCIASLIMVWVAPTGAEINGWDAWRQFLLYSLLVGAVGSLAIIAVHWICIDYLHTSRHGLLQLGVGLAMGVVEARRWSLSVWVSLVGVAFAVLLVPIAQRKIARDEHLRSEIERKALDEYA